MFAGRFSIALVSLAAVLATSVSQAQEAAKDTLPPEQKKLLDNIRVCLAERDLPGAQANLKAAQEEQGADLYQKEVERLGHLVSYMVQFWESVDAGGKKFQATEEIIIDTGRAAFVEYNGGRIVYKHEGQMKRYTLADMKPKVAVALALKHLDIKAPTTKVFVGAFWAMDKMGDKAAAKRLWTQAKSEGVKQVDLLLPELLYAAPGIIELPKLTAANRALLSPANWLIQVRDGRQVKRGPLGAAASTNAEGRLKIQWPAELKQTVQLVFRRRAAGDFKVHMLLKDVREGQQFGLWSADSKNEGWYVTLPEGAVDIEFSRDGDKFACTLNGEPAKIESLEGSNPKLSGLLGLTLPPGTDMMMALFESQ